MALDPTQPCIGGRSCKQHVLQRNLTYGVQFGGRKAAWFRETLMFDSHHLHHFFYKCCASRCYGRTPCNAAKRTCYTKRLKKSEQNRIPIEPSDLQITWVAITTGCSRLRSLEGHVKGGSGRGVPYAQCIVRAHPQSRRARCRRQLVRTK